MSVTNLIQWFANGGMYPVTFRCSFCGHGRIARFVEKSYSHEVKACLCDKCGMTTAITRGAEGEELADQQILSAVRMLASIQPEAPDGR